MRISTQCPKCRKPATWMAVEKTDRGCVKLIPTRCECGSRHVHTIEVRSIGIIERVQRWFEHQRAAYRDWRDFERDGELVRDGYATSLKVPQGESQEQSDYFDSLIHAARAAGGLLDQEATTAATPERDPQGSGTSGGERVTISAEACADLQAADRARGESHDGGGAILRDRAERARERYNLARSRFFAIQDRWNEASQKVTKAYREFIDAESQSVAFSQAAHDKGETEEWQVQGAAVKANRSGGRFTLEGISEERRGKAYAEAIRGDYGQRIQLQAKSEGSDRFARTGANRPPFESTSIKCDTTERR